MRRAPDLGQPAAVRFMDEIQEVESDREYRPSRASALILASIGGACIVFAALVIVRNPSKEKPVGTDPLAALVDKSREVSVNEKPHAKDDRIREPITFPSRLSDGKKPTAALEAVREGVHSSAEPPLPPEVDQLPVVPLPAQNVLYQSPDADKPTNDTLTTMAQHAAREDSMAEVAPGTPGGYQLQVSSFKEGKDAENFAAALRRRGHRAYVETAEVKTRGRWYRVRIGPFKFKHSAVIYRQDFEAKERLVTFIVEPPKENKL